MRVLVTGSSGFVGHALVPFLEESGQSVTRLLRRTPRPGQSAHFWDPDAGVIKDDYLEGFDAVIHLAGESIAAGRWTTAKKERIHRSRVEGTRVLSEVLARLRNPPKTFLCASATGFYGHRGETTLREGSPCGTGFLAEVCRAWEAAAEPAARRGIRLVSLRFGIILSPMGGALAKILPPFRFGLGGRIGSGRQYISWIALDEVLRVILHVLRANSLQGPVNVVAPSPVTNSEFAETLGRVLKRRTLFPMPAFVARLVFGEMAEELLLASTRAAPAKLLHAGYQFLYPSLEGALRNMLAIPS